jgi:dolichol-phosphate mannosyltransferase
MIFILAQRAKGSPRSRPIQSIQIEENRFGFEPEVVAKIAQKRLRVYEMGISYRGRS